MENGYSEKNVILCGKKYFIVYDDKFSKPMKKEGIVRSVEWPLFILETVKGEEILNYHNVIRGEEVSEYGRRTARD